MSNVFQHGDFTLNSGRKSKVKVCCEFLTPADWDTFAFIASKMLPDFGAVESIPTGGNRFAAALEKYKTPGCPITLIADDVLTTGNSFEKHRGDRRPLVNVLGVVAFCRKSAYVPYWIYPLWTAGFSEDI